MFTPSGRFTPGKKVTLCSHTATTQLLMRISAMYVDVRLSSRKLEPVMVCGYHSVGKLPSRCATQLSAGRPQSLSSLRKYLNDTDNQGLQSFMTEDSDAVGSMRSSVAQRTAFAFESLNFNMRDK
jgi:hypothetical protein